MYHIQAKARSNSKKYGKTIASFPLISDVKKYLDDNHVHATERPYFFTHIKLSDNTIVTQTVTIGTDNAEITCSPTSLAEALGI